MTGPHTSPLAFPTWWSGRATRFQRVLLLVLCWVLALSSWGSSGDVVRPFRFALLSDLHINGTGTTALEDLRQSVDQINQSDSIAFVLVTGDIADNGDDASLRLVKDELDRLRMPYHIIMGNHDQKWSASGGTAFTHIFGSERFEFSYGGCLFLGFSSGPLLRMALGHVAPEDISWLEERLQANASTGQPVFLVDHIPMTETDMDNWMDVTDRVRRYQVVAFLNGHYHRNELLSCDGLPAIVNTTNLRHKGQHAGQYNEYDVDTDSVRVYLHPVGGQRHHWASLPMNAEGYRHDGPGNAPRPSYAVNDSFPQVRTGWKKALGAGIYSSPVVVGRRFYVADALGRLFCKDLQTGETLWMARTGGRILGTPDADKHCVVVASADSLVHAFDVKTGRELWTCTMEAPSVSAVNLVEGIAYVGGSDGKMRAISTNDGKTKWVFDGVGGYVETRPLVTRDLIVFGAWDNTLYALSRKDGRLVWKCRICPDKGMHYSPAAVWPVAANGCVFIVDPERALSAVDMKDGHILWRTYNSKVRESLGLSADGRRLYAKTMQDSVVCYAAEGASPRELWATNVGFGYEHATTMLPERDGIVYGSTKNGLVFALDGLTGRLLWKHKTGNTLVNTVVPLAHGSVLLTDEYGNVERLDLSR